MAGPNNPFPMNQPHGNRRRRSSEVIALELAQLFKDWEVERQKWVTTDGRGVISEPNYGVAVVNGILAAVSALGIVSPWILSTFYHLEKGTSICIWEGASVVFLVSIINFVASYWKFTSYCKAKKMI
jgi:hypothetical protein